MSQNWKNLHKKYKFRRVFLITLGIIAVLAVGLFAGSKIGESSANSVLGESAAVLDVVDAEPSTKTLIASTEPTPTEPTIEPTQPNPDDWMTVVVSNTAPLDESFEVKLAQITGKHMLDERIVTAFKQMVAKAKADGISLMVFSAYREPTEQDELFKQEVESLLAKGLTSEVAYEKAVITTPEAWHSEHHTGLAVDISTEESGVNNSFEETPAFKWLEENAGNYGFVLRYLKDKDAITGHPYTPCHFRFVGEENAKIIWENDYTLEEFLYIKEKQEHKQTMPPENEDIEGEETSTETPAS